MNETYIKNVVEAALLAAGRPLQLAEITQLFDENARPDPAALRAALESLETDYGNRGIEVKETATGFRIQVKRDLANEVSRLWPERPPRYSRALLETLALIAYRQPITRAEIEAVRGVAVNPNIIKTVLERNWVRVVGTRDVPGRPELLGTTREFLDYFGLRTLEDLPPLAELKAMGEINLQLDLAKPNEPSDPEGGGSEGSGGADGGVQGGEGGNGASGAVAAAAVAVAVGVVAEALEPLPVEEGAREAAAEETRVDVVASDDAAAPAQDDAPQALEEAAVFSEIVEPEAPDVIASAEVEADSGDVTVEVETLGLVEARIEASIESDDEPVADAAIETGEFELAELSGGKTGSLIEAEFEADDLDAVALDDDSADADDEEELSAGPHSSSELVAAPRDRDD